MYVYFLSQRDRTYQKGKSTAESFLNQTMRVLDCKYKLSPLHQSLSSQDKQRKSLRPSHRHSSKSLYCMSTTALLLEEWWMSLGKRYTQRLPSTCSSHCTQM